MLCSYCCKEINDQAISCYHLSNPVSETCEREVKGKTQLDIKQVVIPGGFP